MPADETQHHHFVRLSAVVSADRTQLNNKIILYFGFSSGFGSGLTIIKSRHSSKPFNVRMCKKVFLVFVWVSIFHLIIFGVRLSLPVIRTRGERQRVDEDFLLFFFSNSRRFQLFHHCFYAQDIHDPFEVVA